MSKAAYAGSAHGPYGGAARSPIMPSMNPPATAPTRRLVLVPADPRSGRGEAAVRRYRLARLRLEDRDVRPAERFSHCKRSYD
jgi:hypothetical protein